MGRCVLNQTADVQGAALVALLCGAWWAAPSAHVPDEAGNFSPPKCGACRSMSACLPLHLIMGTYANEEPCSCRNAAACRSAWETEVAGLYAAHANAPAATAFATVQPRSFARLALMLGRRAGIELPWVLASRLPSAFVRTWGAWSETALGVP